MNIYEDLPYARYSSIFCDLFLILFISTWVCFRPSSPILLWSRVLYGSKLHSHSVLLREGNGSPLHYSCLESSMDRGAWWAAVHGVAQSRTWLKRLSMHACIGEGNGNPLQYSCLENPRDRVAWWAAVSGVAQSWAWLKHLSSSSSSSSSVLLLTLFYFSFWVQV